MQVISFGSKIGAAKQAATGLKKTAQKAVKPKGATMKKPLTADVFNKAAKPAGHK